LRIVSTMKRLAPPVSAAKPLTMTQSPSRALIVAQPGAAFDPLARDG
jgi:hypothetical protein